MQRCGIGGEGETGGFKCLTLSTLTPPPTRGLSLRAARHAHHVEAGRASDRRQPAPARRRAGCVTGFCARAADGLDIPKSLRRALGPTGDSLGDFY
jgi:hypothetical protein